MSNGNDDVISLLEQYGNSLEDVQALLPQLVGAVEKLKQPVLKTAQFLTPADVESMGFTNEAGEPLKLGEGWLLKVAPGTNGTGDTFSFIAPDKWEITQDQTVISPTGQISTLEEWQAQQGTEVTGAEDIYASLQKVFPGVDLEEMLTRISITQPMSPVERDKNTVALENFYKTLSETGRTPETEQILSWLGATEEEITGFFATPEELDVTQEAQSLLGKAWGQLTSGEFKWSEVKDTLMGALGVVGAYLEKYVGRPWEWAVMEAKYQVELMGGQVSPQEAMAVEIFQKAYREFGAGAIFSEEMSTAWEEYWKTQTDITNPQLQKTMIEWANPVYWIPIGAAFGQAARWTSRVPLLGRVMEDVAVGVRAVEKGITYPIAKPATLGLGGLEKIGAGLGEKIANKLIGESKNLLIEIPTSEQLIQGVVVDNWIKKALQLAAKIPFVKGGIERALGWRILVDREGQLLESIVGRGGVAYAEIQRMGINTARWKIAELYAIDANPVKLFGLNKAGFSQTMLNRLLPEYAEQRGIAGTLEHIFTNPEMYNLTKKQLLYVTRVAEVNQQVLNLLIKEGIPPEHVIEDWIHRIVTSRTTAEGEEILAKGRPGMGGTRIGAKAAYEKPRTFETMADGLAAGYRYDPDITHSIGTYIESAFNKIAAERFENYVGELGRTPLERLAERYPGLAEKAALTQTELADAAKFQSVINRGIRGEDIPEQTLRAMEKRFPELGKKFRAIIKGEPLKPIDEAAYLADFGAKDTFGYPQVVPVKPLGKFDWDILTIEEKVAYVKSLGLEGKIGSKSWEALTAEERNLLLTGETVKPKIDGIPELAGETEIKQVKFESPSPLSATERKTQLTALRDEVKALTEARKAPYWQARAEKARAMEIVRQPSIGEGYIMQPFAGGKIYSQEFIDTFNKFFGYDKGLGILKVTGDMAGILRITKAALDFSAMAIQGLPSFGLAHAYMLTNPQIGFKLMGRWYEAFGYSVGSFFNPDIFWKYMAKQGESIGQRISFGGSARAVDYFTALEAKGGLGGFGNKVLSSIPLNPFERAEITFYAGGEVVRDEFWRILSPKALAIGKEFELARQLDLITGLFEAKAAGVPLTIRQLESTFVWFAPNYTRACLTVLADIFRGGYTGGMARKALGGLIAAGGAYYTGVQFGIASLEGKSPEEAWKTVMEGFGVREDPITHEITWKPSAQFMTLKIGNYNFGFGGFWYGLVRLAGNINDTINEVGDKEVIDLVRILKNGTLNKDNPFIYWWYSRSSPLVGTGFELASGKDFLGYPIETPTEYAKYILTRFEPIWMEQGINWLIPGIARDNEIPEGAARLAVAPAELFGLRTFPESSWTTFYDKVNEYIQHIPENEIDTKQLEAWRKGELGWAQLTDIQKSNLLARYPDLNELYGEAQADSAVRQSDEWEAYQSRIEEERGIYYQRIEDLTQQLLRGEIDTATYREKAGEAGMNYGAILDAMQRDPVYAQIYEYFDKKTAEGDKYGFLDDLALAEYQSQILYADDLTLPNGDYNWDERDKRVDAFIENWGQEVYDRIQSYLTQEKGLKGLNAVWIRKAQDTEKLGREYWRLPYKPISEMDATDEINGDIPAEYLVDWKTYQILTTDAEKEAFVLAHPEFGKDWRAEYRKNNPEADAMLALWGYGGKLQSMEAYNLVEQWSKELGIPLESMGLGLPPRSLAEAYFGYTDLSRQFSGNSAQVKLFRLEHPEFDTWGQENWGWKPIDTPIEKLQIAIEWDEKWSKLDDEYKNLPIAGYEQEWFLMEHSDFYNAAREYYDWQEKDFDKVPTREVWGLYQEYEKLPVGKERMNFRLQHPDLDAWLVLAKGYKPAK